jgi:hypothetical protein
MSKDTIEAMDGITNEDIDKRFAQFSLRIPEYTKHLIDSLPKTDKVKMNMAILMTIDRAIHDSKYVPGSYLKETPD